MALDAGRQPITVFLSGAQASKSRGARGVQDERDAAATVFGDDPILRKLFFLFRIEEQSAPTTVDASYTNEVENCQMFLLIIGDEVRPAVKDEFLLARQHGKPVFAFVKDSGPQGHSDAVQDFIRDVASYTTYTRFRSVADFVQKVSRNFAAWLLTTGTDSLKDEATWVTQRLKRRPVPKRIAIGVQRFRSSRADEPFAADCLRYDWSIDITYPIDSHSKIPQGLKILLVSYPAGYEDKGASVVNSLVQSDDYFTFVACPLVPPKRSIDHYEMALQGVKVSVASLSGTGARALVPPPVCEGIDVHDNRGIVSALYYAEIELSKARPTVSVQFSDVPHALSRGYMVFNAGDVATDEMRLQIEDHAPSLRGRITPIIHEKAWRLEQTSSTITANPPHVIVPTEGFILEMPRDGN